MRTLNTRYTSDSELHSFIESNEIARCEQVLVQVFCGVVDEALITKLTALIGKKIPHAHIIGCTTAGEILGGSMLEWSVVVSFSLFEKTTLASTFVALNEHNDAAAQTILEQVATEKTKVLIVLSDGMKSNGEGLIHALGRRRNDIVIAGGRAGDNYEFKKSYVFDKTRCSESGAAVVALDSQSLTIANRHLFNWQCIGKHMEVTKAEGGRIYELDCKPVTEVYRHYLGDGVADALPAAGIEFPLVFLKGDTDVGRAPISAFDDGSLLFAGSIDEGEQVRFGFGSFDMMDEGAKSVYADLSRNLVESIHIYSCSARKAFFGKDLEKEFTYLNSLAETAGFFTYGEYFHTDTTNELLNITTTILALSESDAPGNPHSDVFNFDVRNTSMKALTHLANRTSAELEELNRSLEKKVEEEVEKNRQKDHLLLQQNRHAAMGEMVRNIAHQWRQPLNALSIVMQNIELAYEQGRMDGEFLQSSIGKGILLIERMSATIDDFRNFFMPSKQKMLFSLCESIRDVLGIVEATFKHLGVRIELAGLEDDIRVFGHENEFAHVILNLLNNAKDALVASKVDDPTISVNIRDVGELISISVSDNGGGIDPSVMEAIFDPYFTTKHDTKGMGIGLYMSRIIIEEHMEGRITVENSGPGARFTITLPKSRLHATL